MDDELRREHDQLRAQARQQRREFATSNAGRVAREINGAVIEYLQMRAQGVSFEDGCKGLEEILRSSGLFRLTKFLPACDTCGDTGWRYRYCTHQHRCRRRSCEDSHPAQEHLYVEPCSCEKGEQRQKRVMELDDEIAAASRVAKRKRTGFSRFGD